MVVWVCEWVALLREEEVGEGSGSLRHRQEGWTQDSAFPLFLRAAISKLGFHWRTFFKNRILHGCPGDKTNQTGVTQGETTAGLLRPVFSQVPSNRVREGSGHSRENSAGDHLTDDELFPKLHLWAPLTGGSPVPPRGWEASHPTGGLLYIAFGIPWCPCALFSLQLWVCRCGPKPQCRRMNQSW